ncbi:MAG: hypothetical protein KatS3mg042_1389 [Rhodothermaceae bacterium]|nr:MAG: hypothetical protein KatS3mg042_1389 [Rhodothermaceae bacterium]
MRVYENTNLPQVAFTPPEPVAPGQRLTLAAEASIAQGSIDHVAFLQGDGVLGTVSSPPYTLDVDNVQPGCYRVAARAVDAQGWFTRTSASDLQIGAGDCPQAPYLMAPHPVPGTIEAEYFDLGGPGVGYLDLDTQNQGQGIRTDEGVDIESTADDGGGYNIGWTAAREWLAYTIDVQETGLYTLQARVASPQSGNRFRIEVDGVPVSEDVEVPDTGDWQAWATATAEGIALTEGLHTLKFRFLTGGFNLNHLTLTREQPTGTETGDQPGRPVRLEVYPNPSRQTSRVVLDLPEPGPVALVLYDVAGRRVRTLLEGHLPAGQQEIPMPATGLSPGLYLVRLNAAHHHETRAWLYLGN